MLVRLYTINNKYHKPIIYGFAKGISKYNVKVQCHNIHSRYQPCDILVTFGILKKVSFRGKLTERLITQHYKHLQKPFDGKSNIVVERGFLHRDRYYMVGWGGLNNRANFLNDNSPPDRWNKLGIALEDWSAKRGDNILLCGQIPWDSSVQHIDFIKWCHNTVKKLQKYTKRKIIFRPHPSGKNIFKKIKGVPTSQNKDLVADLSNTWCTVTFNSNTGVDSLLHNIPVYAYDEGSMVWDICTKDLEHIDDVQPPPIEFRQQWVYNLAYTQWNLEELKSGETWDHLRKGISDM